MKNKEAVELLEEIKAYVYKKREHTEAKRSLYVLALNKGITALENQSDELAAERLEIRRQIHIAEMRRMNVLILVLAILTVAVFVFAFMA